MDRHTGTVHPLLIACAAVAVYWLWAALLVWQNPGLQYDEALLVSGAVHMLRSPAELTIPHDPDTWVCIRGRCFPLMSVRYVGPIKDYLCLPLFALFGAQTIIIRLVSIFLASIGLFGLAKLIADHVGPVVAGCAGLALAISPTYTDLTVFDNNAVAPMMAAFGLLCLAVSYYLRQRNTLAALWIGAAMGFGVWARANTVWFLAAFCGAAILVLNTRLLRVPRAHWLAWIAGGLLGGMPFLIYQVNSRGGTWQGLEIFANHQPWTDQLYGRFVLFSEMLLSDREHRAMWDGPFMPDWQRWLWAAMFFSSCAVPWLLRGRNGLLILWARFASATAILLTAAMFASRLALSEHHLVAVLPVAVASSVLSAALIMDRSRWAKGAVISSGLVYAACALFWQVSAVRGLARTGGTGPWSDGIYRLAERLDARYPKRLIRILDWGLMDNLYVLTQGRLRGVENYADAGRSWPAEIETGGVFLANAAGNYQFPAATQGFLRSLENSHANVRRFTAQQKNDAPFAEIFDIQPVSRLSLVQPSVTNQLVGFHKAEASGWRWTERRFAMTLPMAELPPETQGHLILQLYVPQPVLSKLHDVTLSASVNGHILTAATYRRAGKQDFEAKFPASWLNPQANRFDFTLDKALPPSKSDVRELGIILVTATLQMDNQ